MCTSWHEHRIRIIKTWKWYREPSSVHEENTNTLARSSTQYISPTAPVYKLLWAPKTTIYNKSDRADQQCESRIGIDLAKRTWIAIAIDQRSHRGFRITPEPRVARDVALWVHPWHHTTEEVSLLSSCARAIELLTISIDAPSVEKNYLLQSPIAWAWDFQLPHMLVTCRA